jgi:hypothetical protein
LSFDPRTRPEAHQRFKRLSKRKKKTMWRPFHKTVKTSDHRTFTETTKVNHNGGTTTLATTQIAII